MSDFTARVKKLKIGDPSLETTEVGALISEGHLQKVLSYIDLAQMEGGKVECGGKQLHLHAPLDGGYFVEPTVITGLVQNYHTNQEEILRRSSLSHAIRN